MHGKQRRKMMMAIKRQQRRALWNSILVATSMPFFAAYGDKENPFSRDNLILTGSLVGWMLGDEIIDKVVGGKGGKGRNRMWSRGSDAWSYIAPAGNALTVWYLLKDRQHTRFLTGRQQIQFTIGAVPDPAGGGGMIVSTTYNNGSNAIPLEVAADYVTDFANLAGQNSIRAVATLVSGAGTGSPEIVGVTAVVAKNEAGAAVLRITPTFRTAPAEANVGTYSFEVAWVVDTKDPTA